MSITGHKTAQEVGRYTRSAEQMKLAEQAMGLLKVSNPPSSVRHFHHQAYDKSAQFEGAGRPGGARNTGFYSIISVAMCPTIAPLESQSIQ